MIRLAIAGLGLLVATPLAAQTSDPSQTANSASDSAADLAKKLANPISSMISVPFQENVDFGIGAEEGWKSTLNVQPVVPFALSPKINLITRTIVPVIYQQDVLPGESQFGLGDVTQSFFFSPATSGSGGIVWGAGPVLQYRTETDAALGTGKWGAGPTIVVVKQAGHNTFGVLANHIWSIAGDDARPDISATYIQPFVSHTTPRAATFSLNLEASYDWKADQWVVPVIAQASQLTHFGDQPVSLGLGLRYFAEKPSGGPDWGLRLNLTLIFARR